MKNNSLTRRQTGKRGVFAVKFSLTRSELLKLVTSKRLILFLLVLFVLHAGFAAAEAWTGRDAVPASAVRMMLDRYHEDPEALLADHREYEDALAQMNARYEAAFAQGLFDYEEDPPENRYASAADEGLSDGILYDALFSCLEAGERHRAACERIVAEAGRNLALLEAEGHTADDVLCRVQQAYIDRYEELPGKVMIREEPVGGWGGTLSYDGGGVWLFLACLLVSASVFGTEFSSGSAAVLRLSKNGRTKTALAKTAALFLSVLSLSLLFESAKVILFCSVRGWDGAGCAVQQVEGFLACPLALSVRETALAFAAFRVLVFFSVSLGLTWIGLFLRSELGVTLAGFGFYAASFGLSRLSRMTRIIPAARLNFLDLSAVHPLCERLNAEAVFVFRAVVPLSGIAAALALFGILLFGALIPLRWARMGAGRFRFGGQAIRQAIGQPIRQCVGQARRLLPSSRRSENKKTRAYSLSLFSAELCKTLFASRAWIAVLLLLTLRGVYAVKTETNPRGFEDEAYRAYMTALAGEYTPEKAEQIAAERERITSAVAAYPAMLARYENGEITLAEYGDYLREYSYATSHDEPLKSVEKRAASIELAKAAGEDAWFVYDTGWEALLLPDFDFILWLIFALLCSNVFAGEFGGAGGRGGFAPILRTAKNGRGRTFRSKILSSLVLSSLLFLLCAGMDHAVIRRTYELPLANAPIRSIGEFAEFAGHLTIAQVWACGVLIRFAAALLLTLFFCAFSAQTRRSAAAAAAVSALTLAPVLLALSGVSIPQSLDFSRLMSGAPVLLDGAGRSAVMWFGVSAVILTIWAAWRWESGRE